MGGGEVVKKGFLIKSPPLDGGSGMKSWRKRWFCLRSSKVLEYYKRQDGDLKGVINLEDCISVHSALQHKKYKHVFDIETKDRVYYLVSKSADEMMAWVQAVCKLCNFSTSQNNKGSTVTFLPKTPIKQCELPNSASTCPIGDALPEHIHQPEATPGVDPTQQHPVSRGQVSKESSPSLFAPRPGSQGGYVQDILSEVYDVPKNNTLAPSSKQGLFSTVPPVEIPDHYNRPRSITTADFSTGLQSTPFFQDRAQTIVNGYGMPKPVQPRYSNYDYPPPPRPIDEAVSHRRSVSLDHGESGASPTPRLSLDASIPPNYVNFQPLPPPPIDRSTKPHPPKIDRSTKPGRPNSSGGQYDSHTISPFSPPPSADSQASSTSGEFGEPFLSTEVPRKTERSLQYTQVSFTDQDPQPVLLVGHQLSKKPKPAPRSTQPKNTNGNSTNYTKIDLAATNALCRSQNMGTPENIASKLFDMEGSSSDSEEDAEYLKMGTNTSEEDQSVDHYTQLYKSQPEQLQES